MSALTAEERCFVETWKSVYDTGAMLGDGKVDHPIPRLLVIIDRLDAEVERLTRKVKQWRTVHVEHLKEDAKNMADPRLASVLSDMQAEKMAWLDKEAEVERLAAQAPDDADLVVIRERARASQYLDVMNGDFVHAWQMLLEVLRDRDTLLAALDAARARCAEVVRERDEGYWAWSRVDGRWLHAGSTIRRLRRRWAWERRRAGYWRARRAETYMMQRAAERERDEARAERDRVRVALAECCYMFEWCESRYGRLARYPREEDQK